MKCPYCGYHDSKVTDSRTVGDGIRRRRECLSCGARFTTYERVHAGELYVVKRDGRREPFNRDKLLAGVRKATEKRPLPAGAIEELVDSVEAAMQASGKAELPSSVLGDLVMERLRDLDEIAYIRFASVYRAFRDVEDLREELDSLGPRRGRPRSPDQLSLLPDEELDQLAAQPHLRVVLPGPEDPPPAPPPPRRRRGRRTSERS